jgi:potassium-transporting ATPase potassium-binding subunit
VWFLPISLLVTATVLAIPLSRYFAWIMDGKYDPPRILRWLEARLDSGPQNWKQYATALLVFNVALFVYGFIVLALQPVMPLNQQQKGMLSPTTIFNSVISFMTNTNIQHYAGEVHLSNFSQIFFIISNMFLSASVGLCALAAIIRALRGETQVGNFFLDMWRVVIYMLVPAALISGVLFIQQGMPMTYRSQDQVTTLEPGAMGSTTEGHAKPQTIVVGPVGAVVPIKMLGTNGGGFYGTNSAHPFENPSAWTNFITCLDMMLFPFALVLMYGRMLGRLRHAWIIFSVMFVLMCFGIGWSIYYDALKPNPGLRRIPPAGSLRFPARQRRAANASSRFLRSPVFRSISI